MAKQYEHEDPRDCPFCGCDDLCVPLDKDQEFFYVFCNGDDCGAMGPDADSFEGAIVAWNGSV